MLNIIKINTLKKVFVHSGIFHSDDVFSCAMLSLMNNNIIFERVAKAPAILSTGELCVDIGFGEYDHHQSKKAFRKDGTVYSSFGLLFRDFGKEFLSTADIITDVKAINAIYKYLDDTFVIKIDLIDNTGNKRYDIPETVCIRNLNKQWFEPDNVNNVNFINAVKIAKILLLNRIKEAETDVIYFKIAKRVWENAIKNLKGNYIILRHYIPWKEFYSAENYPDIQFIILPNERGGFSVISVDSEKYPINNLTSKEIFIHNSRYMAVVNSLENAKKLSLLNLKGINHNEQNNKYIEP